MKRLIVIGVLLFGLLFATIAQGRPNNRNTPTTPGGARLIQDGNWEFFNIYYTATGVVKLTGCYRIEKAPPGELGHRIYMTWNTDECVHTWLDADITVWESNGR